VCEIGDIARFGSARQLMGYLGLVPSEHSSGNSVRRGSITKTGNAHARRLLTEAAWNYRFPARISHALRNRSATLSPNIRTMPGKLRWQLPRRIDARW
jgi:transposase